MNGAGEIRRRTAPPHASQIVSAGSVMRCRISNTRRHLSHSYSYVGIRISVYMGGRNVSRQATRGFAVIALVVLSTGCAGTTANVPPEAQRLQARSAYERGVSALGEGVLAAALSSFQQAATQDPTVAVYRNALGLVYLQSRRPDLALPEFERATVIDPEYADGFLNTGIALASMAKWDDAVAAYQRAIRLPRLTTHDTAYQNMGWAFYQLKRYREAEEALRLAIGLDPQMVAAYYTLGLVFVAQDRKEDAKLVFRHARALAPDSPFGHAALEGLRALGEGG
jgi:tetratricopeptide (TPR) repeat protein